MNRFLSTCLITCFIVLANQSYAQIRRALGDTTTKPKVVIDPTKPADTPTTAAVEKKVDVPVIKDTLPEMGVSVSPSTMRFNVKPGNLKTMTLKMTNDTKKLYNFQVGFQDYGAGEDGSVDSPVDKYSRYALSKYVVVSPTLIELKPRQTKVVTVTVDIPSGDSMAVSMWTILTLDQVIEREKLEIPTTSPTAIGMGVKNSFGFGINIFQNPPNVIVNNVEIMAMNFNKKTATSSNNIFMKAKNAGTGIGYCLYYLELTNLVTGKQTKLKVKQFAIFPGYSKEFKFELPPDIEKGPYSAMAVLDFGNKEELQTAELEFTVE